MSFKKVSESEDVDLKEPLSLPKDRRRISGVIKRSQSESRVSSEFHKLSFFVNFRQNYPLTAVMLV